MVWISVKKITSALYHISRKSQFDVVLLRGLVVAQQRFIVRAYEPFCIIAGSFSTYVMLLCRRGIELIGAFCVDEVN